MHMDRKNVIAALAALAQESHLTICATAQGAACNAA